MGYKNFAMLNGRIERGSDSSVFLNPAGKALIITDIFAQNRKPGDEPVDPLQFSRLVMGQVSGYDCNNAAQHPIASSFDICYTVVGNENLNIHYQTGLVVTDGFRVSNAPNSTATFAEFTISGYFFAK